MRRETQTTVKCETCHRQFKREGGHGGAIEHENHVGHFNMEVFVSIYNDPECDNYSEIFLDSILLDNGLCNSEHINYDIAIQIFECRIKWLKNEGYDEIADYLKSKRPYIRTEFNKVAIALMKEATDKHESHMKYLNSKLLK